MVFLLISYRYQVYLVLLVALFLGAVYYLWPAPVKEPPKAFQNVPIRREDPKKKKQEEPKNKGKKGPPLKILWGSQTGTAEDFAETLCAEAVKHGFDAESIDLEEYDKVPILRFELVLNSLSKDELGEEEALLILVVATYGEGEPTDNAKDFYEWLMETEREEDLLASVKYTVGAFATTFMIIYLPARYLD